MHRPFYVLFVLLETLAGLLFLVRSVHADNSESAPNGARGGVIIFAWPLDDNLCSADLDGECEGIEDGSVDVLIADEPCDDEEPLSGNGLNPHGTAGGWCPAEPISMAGFELLGTGYDAAYDFAMLQGRYLDVAPSQATFDETSTSPAVVLLAGPSTSLYYEDAEGFLHGGIALSGETCPSTAYAVVELKDAVASEPVEAEGLRDAPASRVEWLARLQGVAAVWDALVAAAGETADVAKVVGRELWIAAVTPRPGLEPSTGNEGTSSHPIGLSTPARVASYHEEVALIEAACALDQLGLRLQEAAQYLRYMAADRIIAKNNDRRVAQRAE